MILMLNAIMIYAKQSVLAALGMALVKVIVLQLVLTLVTLNMVTVMTSTPLFPGLRKLESASTLLGLVSFLLAMSILNPPRI